MSNYASWESEKQAAYLYEVITGVETDPKKKSLFQSMKAGALEQAREWEEKIREEGESPPGQFRPSLRTRTVAALIRGIGPRGILPVLAAAKVRGISVYRSGTVDGERPLPESVEEVTGRHRNVSAGGNLRAAVFGINDGLVSNASLILGVAGANPDPKILMVSGVAGLLAGSFSMAAGEYVSVRSQREMYEYQIGLEREELALYPEEEKEELALIYNARGLSMDRAREFAGEMLKDPEHALNTLSREELGLNPDDLGSPWGAALSSFFAFAIGAFIPLVAFLFSKTTQTALPVSIALSLSGLFLVGAAISLFNGKGGITGGIRMMGIGTGAGAITYLIGKLIGVGLF